MATTGQTMQSCAKNKKKILFNYDYSMAPYHTLFYYEKAAKQSELFTAHRRGDIAPCDADYIVNGESCAYSMTAPGVPSCYYETDSHLIHGWNPEFYDPVDLVLIPHKEHLNYYPKGKTRVLSFAADPELHRPIDGIIEHYDIAFVGNNTYPTRRHILHQLQKRYKVLITNAGAGLPYSREFAKAKLAFNYSMKYECNMRFFECMSMGKVLITDYLAELDEYATAGEHYAAYHDMTSLFKAIDNLLKQPNKRHAIGQAARENIILYHTYKHRLMELINYLNEV